MPKTHLVPSTTFQFFDLPHFLEDIPQDYLRMQTSVSYAWRIDTQLVQAVRTLFKTVRDECRTSELDSMADLNNAFAEQSFAEQCFEDIGSDSTGPVRTIHELLDLRAAAHSAAATATRCVLDFKGNLRTYVEPSISELFTKQGTMKPRPDTLLKMKRNATRRAASVATGKEALELADKLLTRKIDKEQARLVAMGEALKAQAGALETMFNIALQRRPERMPSQLTFHQVDLELQRLLISSTMQACTRAEEWSESDNNISADECDDICLAAELSINTLKKVLKSPRFNCGIDGNAPTSPEGKPLKIVMKTEPVITKPVESKSKAKTKTKTESIDPIQATDSTA